MLVLQAIINKFTTLADGSGRLVIDLQELTPSEFSEVGRVNKKSGVLVFKPDVEGMSVQELEAIKEYKSSGLGDKKKKSKSQVFRHVLYKLYEQEPEGFKTQNEHYDHYMDQIINHFKGKLKKDESNT